VNKILFFAVKNDHHIFSGKTKAIPIHYGNLPRTRSVTVTGDRLTVMTSFQTDDAHFANWHYRRDLGGCVDAKTEKLTYGYIVT
jgi:hypothetical protein